ncbi:MAG: hypothetical protein NE328_17675 [Lentisphaeraceae bacterium]|nr:hypothetical protein [Lentisphaeraceae bacterium]
MKKLLLLLILCFSTGCSTTYWNNRRHDLTDFAHLRFQKVSLGADVNVMHIAAGFYMQNGIDGEKGDRAKLGLGGIQTVNASGGIRFVGFPLAEKKSRSEYGYGETMPAYGSVGFDLGLYFGIGARVDIFEFFDFLLGFAEVDIVKDDEEEPVEYLPRVEP